MNTTGEKRKKILTNLIGFDELRLDCKPAKSFSIMREEKYNYLRKLQ